MPSVNIKRIVSRAVAEYLGANIPALSGNVSSVLPGPETKTVFPSALVETGQFGFAAENPDEVYEAASDDGQLVISVGEFQGTAELRLYAKSLPEREAIEQSVMDLFLSQQDSPGVLYVDTPALTVNGYVSLYSVQIKVRLESADWQEEFAFENRRYSFLDITFAYPALTTRTVANIESLQLALAGLTGDADEIVEIQEDGSIEPVAP